ncbi:hypothetical protein ACM66B_002858 [Microbotryomycetes sp. NB124-2]
MEAVKDLKRNTETFVKEGNQFMTRCTKPDQKEYLQIARAVAIGFAIMGVIGYVVRLVHIPVVHILVGSS